MAAKQTPRRAGGQQTSAGSGTSTPTVAQTADAAGELAAQLRRRREASRRLPPLECGHHDPLDCGRAS